MKVNINLIVNNNAVVGINEIAKNIENQMFCKNDTFVYRMLILSDCQSTQQDFNNPKRQNSNETDNYSAAYNYAAGYVD